LHEFGKVEKEGRLDLVFVDLLPERAHSERHAHEHHRD